MMLFRTPIRKWFLTINKVYIQMNCIENTEDLQQQKKTFEGLSTSRQHRHLWRTLLIAKHRIYKNWPYQNAERRLVFHCDPEEASIIFALLLRACEALDHWTVVDTSSERRGKLCLTALFDQTFSDENGYFPVNRVETVCYNSLWIKQDDSESFVIVCTCKGK